MCSPFGTNRASYLKSFSVQTTMGKIKSNTMNDARLELTAGAAVGLFFFLNVAGWLGTAGAGHTKNTAVDQPPYLGLWSLCSHLEWGTKKEAWATFARCASSLLGARPKTACTTRFNAIRPPVLGQQSQKESPSQPPDSTSSRGFAAFSFALPAQSIWIVIALSQTSLLRLAFNTWLASKVTASFCENV